MRVCRSCGRENADESDFCACGEYLRWEPTSYMPAAAPSASAAPSSAGPAPASSPPPSAPPTPPSSAPRPPAPGLDPNITLGPEALSGAGHGNGAGRRGGAPPGAAALSLRLPGDDEPAEEGVAVPVEPGSRTTILGHIRNQSEVVDNFDLKVRGLPEGWWTIAPATTYLVPYGSGGSYEQEFQVHLHPPRTPQAQARPWTFEVVAASRAFGGEAASAPATVTIGPYKEVAAEVRPERASGRLKARYVLTVRNKANSRTEVDLAGEDTDGKCTFRFAQPRIALEPGNAMECPFTVFPPSQIWIGRPKDHVCQVTAAPVGVDPPPPALPATYRQRPWLPRWVALAVPIVVALAVLAIKLLPKKLVVPNVKGQPSMWSAEKILTKAGLQMWPKPTSVPANGKPVGSIADQNPSPGAKAKKGAFVTVEVYAASGTAGAKIAVPNLVGQTAAAAIQALTKAGLTAGTLSPQPPSPDATIVSEYPFAGEKVAAKSPVNLFLKTASSSKTKKAGVSAAAVAAASAAGAAAAAANGSATPAALAAAAKQAGDGPIAVPTLPTNPNAAAAAVLKLGLTPELLRQLSSAPVGQTFGSVPAAGAKVARGAVVDVLISNGSPELAFDSNGGVDVTDPPATRSLVQIQGSGPVEEPAWSPTGSELVYTQNGALKLLDVAAKGAQPQSLTAPPSGTVDEDPSFAPTSRQTVIAYIERRGTSSSLCFLTHTQFATNSSCTAPSSYDLGDEVDWSPDGTTILVLGATANGSQFGLVSYHSSVPYSADATNWAQPTPQGQPWTTGQGIIAGEFSPDGKQMALVDNLGSGYQLFIVPVGDYTPTKAQSENVNACQISWRPDGKELAVMQADNGPCNATATGTIYGVTLADPQNLTTLAPNGAHPAWQPLSSGG